MATEKPDIFVGSYVRVAINRDTTSEIPSYFDPGYVETKNLAAFPSVEVGHEVEAIEDYRDDFTTKLVGNAVVKDTTISVLDVPEDDFIKELEDALLEKRKLRFRNLYVIDTENGEKSQNGLYHIFDAYVQKSTTSGGSDSVVTRTYNLSPEGQVFQGFAQVGEILRQGDFGVGAGTEEIPGVKDIGALTGNRWVTVDASNTQNPFNADTSLMAIQHPNHVGWELIGQTAGKPALRVRNKKIGKDGLTVESSEWVKVYSETDKPTAKEVGALPITGGTVTGDVRVNREGFNSQILMGKGDTGIRTGGADGDALVIGTPGNIYLRPVGLNNNESNQPEIRISNTGATANIRMTATQFTASSATPSAASDLTRKDYVDNQVNTRIPLNTELDYGTF